MKPMHKLVDNIKMDLEEIGWRDEEWIPLIQETDKWGVGWLLWRW